MSIRFRQLGFAVGEKLDMPSKTQHILLIHHAHQSTACTYHVKWMSVGTCVFMTKGLLGTPD